MGWNHQPEYTWLITSHVIFVVKLNLQMQKVVHPYVKILQILSQCSQSQQRAWQYHELRAETERLKAADVAATLLLSEKEEALSHGRIVGFKFQSGRILIEPFVWISGRGNLFEFLCSERGGFKDMGGPFNSSRVSFGSCFVLPWAGCASVSWGLFACWLLLCSKTAHCWWGKPFERVLGGWALCLNVLRKTHSPATSEYVKYCETLRSYWYQYWKCWSCKLQSNLIVVESVLKTANLFPSSHSSCQCVSVSWSWKWPCRNCASPETT